MDTKRILSGLAAISFSIAACSSDNTNSGSGGGGGGTVVTVNDAHFWTSLSATPLIRWTDFSTGNYEISIVTTAGATDILNWTNVGATASTTQTGLTLVNGTTYFANVREVSGTTVTSSNGWTVRTTGTGAFAAAASLTATGNPRDARFADLNSDGFIDIVSADGGSGGVGTSVSVFLATGAGTFAPAYQIATPTNPQNIEVVDVTLDGKLDIIVATYGPTPGTVQIFPGVGDGSFGAGQS